MTSNSDHSRAPLSAGTVPQPGEWSDAQIGRLIDQSQQISRMLSEAGVGACTLVEGVRELVNRQSAACNRHGDPLICLACEAEEDARPEWQVDLEPLKALARTHRFPKRDPFADQLSAALHSVIAEVERLRVSAGTVPQPESTENIPEFIEPRYWIERGMHGWGVFYRQEGRKLGVGCVQGVDEAVARNVAKALNDVLYEEVTAYTSAGAVPSPHLQHEEDDQARVDKGIGRPSTGSTAASHEAPSPLTGWQPIETAPKDRRILVFMRDDALSRAWQYEDGDPSKLVALASWTNRNGGGWVSYHPGKPTHWMPLPESPLAADAVARTEGDANACAVPAVSSAPPPASEEEVIKRVVDHWFIQGGEAQFGSLGEPTNPDELISAILERVRKDRPAVSTRDGSDGS